MGPPATEFIDPPSLGSWLPMTLQSSFKFINLGWFPHLDFTLWGRDNSLHFTDEETEDPRGGICPKLVLRLPAPMEVILVSLPHRLWIGERWFGAPLRLRLCLWPRILLDSWIRDSSQSTWGGRGKGSGRPVVSCPNLSPGRLLADPWDRMRGNASPWRIRVSE